VEVTRRHLRGAAGVVEHHLGRTLRDDAHLPLLHVEPTHDERAVGERVVVQVAVVIRPHDLVQPHAAVARQPFEDAATQRALVDDGPAAHVEHAVEVEQVTQRRAEGVPHQQCGAWA
jgi:hypothetical protein